MEREKRRLAYFYITPALVWLLLFIGFPIVDIVKTSFYDTSYKGEFFVGLDNYVGLTEDDVFSLIVQNTAQWTGLAVLTNVILGLVVALLLQRKTVLGELLRVLLILAWATPLVVATISWKWMYNGEYGHLNALLLKFNVIDVPIQWLTGASTAFSGALIARLWTSFPFTTFAFLSALHAIPVDLYEAANIDGTTKAQRFWYITLPMLRPVSLAVLLISFIWAFNSFVFIYVITAGGPANQTQIMVAEIFRRAFGYFNFGEASVLAVLSFLVLLIASLFQWQLLHKDGVDS